MDKFSQLEQLKKLLDSGALTESEYYAQKEKILNAPEIEEKNLHWGTDERNFSVFMHLSQYSSFVVPFAGMILPIVMWSTERTKSPFIDQVGVHIVNWIISSIIYGIIFGVLCFAIVGIPLLIALVIVMLIYPAIGAIKAGNGEAWRPPFTINFLSTLQ
jgi:uncharacterized protein